MPPSPSTVLFLDEEVAADEEGIEAADANIDVNAAAADADDYAADDIAAAAADDDYATMPPKVKPIPMKPTKKDMAAASAKLASDCKQSQAIACNLEKKPFFHDCLSS